MTPQQPDDEFRVTRWQLEQIAKYADLERIVWACLNKPTSRPAPSPDYDLIITAIGETMDNLILEFTTGYETDKCDIPIIQREMDDLIETIRKQKGKHDAALIAQARNDVTIDDFCIVDLTLYIQQSAMASEDVSRCRGKECNYCGKFNESLRTGGEPR